MTNLKISVLEPAQKKTTTEHETWHHQIILAQLDYNLIGTPCNTIIIMPVSNQSKFTDFDLIEFKYRECEWGGCVDVIIHLYSTALGPSNNLFPWHCENVLRRFMVISLICFLFCYFYNTTQYWNWCLENVYNVF